MAPKKKERRSKKQVDKKTNKYTELFEEDTTEHKRNDSVEGYDSPSDDKRESQSDDDPNAKGVALFDLDLYGRKVTDRHAAGFGRGGAGQRKAGRKAALDTEESSDGSLEGQNEDNAEEDEDESDDDDNDQSDDLERAIFDEWDMIALEEARRAVDDGLSYFWDGIGEDRHGKTKTGATPPLLLPRIWESSFFITAFQNIENKPQFFFYVITFGHINKNRKISGALRRRVLYSPGFYLRSGEYKALNAPLPIWPKKIIPVSYKELGNYAVTVDLWKISSYTFNTLYASTTLTLQDVVDMDPDASIMLQRKLPNKKRSYEVQRLKASFQLSEVFDFDLFFESWLFNPSRNFNQNYASLPKLPKGSDKGWKVKWTEPSTSGFWESPLTFVYRGTMQNLQNAYFIVKVYVKTNDGAWFKRPTLIGTALMSLRSVVTYSLFRSIVKQLTIQEERFTQGEIIGNIRCFIRSTGLPYYEDAAVVKRPVQPLAGAALVTQLDFREQFLVVRLFRCENLPAANLDAGTSDPVVKVKWDGMTNASAVRNGTLRPVWNQNLYFPIRLLDPCERTISAYIKTCLPLDLLSKGNVIFECWDQDETSSDFLGGCEFHLSQLLTQGEPLPRCLAEGLGKAETEGARMPDGRPAGFQYQGEDAVEADVIGLDTHESTPQPYEAQYLTRVYNGNGVELTGATIATSTTARPLIYFEVFCIPPLPKELSLPGPQLKEEQDLWKQWSRRWERDFTKWLHIYAEWFPAAPNGRRFICTADHPQTRRLHPLPAFVIPIALPKQISDVGELLHWVSNMTFLISTKQHRTGLLPRWLSPNYFLITRKGGINDHAVLLCSCLLGLNYDAYVCKGTINDGKDEHCWVMTRHDDGWVVFWEVTNKKRYHLPARWGYKPLTQIHTPQDTPPMTIKLESDTNPYYEGEFLQAWYAKAAAECGVNLNDEVDGGDNIGNDIYGDDVVPDIRVDDVDVELETWDKQENQTKKRGFRNKIDLDKVRAWMETQIDSIPIAPQKSLLNVESTLCYVPYSSIEVVFNNEQLWGNLQNHHPAVIYYDLEDQYLWRTFLTEIPKAIDNFIYIAPATLHKACDSLCCQLQADVAENIRVLRGRRGLETQVDHGEDKAERLDKYIELLEFRLRLDPDYDPGPPANHKAWSAWGAYESVENVQDYSTDWYSHLQKDPEKVTLFDWDPNQVEPSTQGINAEEETRLPNVPNMTISAATSEGMSGRDAYMPQKLAVLHHSKPNQQPNISSQPIFQQAAIHGIAMSLSDHTLTGSLNTQTSLETTQDNLIEDHQQEDNTIQLSLSSSNNSVTPNVTSDQEYHPDSISLSINEHTQDVKSQSINNPAIYIRAGCRAMTHHSTEGLPPMNTFLTPATFGTFDPRKHKPNEFDNEDNEFRNLNPKIADTPERLLLSDDDDDDIESNESDTEAVLRYCKSRNIYVASSLSSLHDTIEDDLTDGNHATLITTQTLCNSEKNVTQQDVQRDFSVNLPIDTHINHELSSTPEPRDENLFANMLESSLTCTELSTDKDDVDEEQDETISNRSSIRFSQTVKKKTQSNSPDPLWDTFEDLYRVTNKIYRNDPQHEMILDDYEEFEKRKKTAKNNGDALLTPTDLLSPSKQSNLNISSPTGPKSSLRSSPRSSLMTPAENKQAQVEDEDFYKILQKPAKAPIADELHGEGLDIQKLGFAISDGPSGAVQPIHKSFHKDDASGLETIEGSASNIDDAIDIQQSELSITSSKNKTATVISPVIPVGPDATGVPPPQVFRRPILRAKYQVDQTAKWNSYYRLEGLFYESQSKYFPVRPSHTFCGFPLHLATTDSSDIRGFLLASKRFRKIIEIPLDGVTYIIRCKVFPLVGGVVSCWLFIGCEIHWAGKQERQTRMKLPKKKVKRKNKPH